VFSIWRRLAALLRRDRLARDLEEEIRGHYDDLRQSFGDAGHSPDEAARLARLRLGGGTQIRESSHDAWRFGALEGAWQDVRIAFRGLRRRPGFTLAAVATLALGIGASTAIFSVAYGVSLRPLPYADPDRLIRIYESNPAKGQTRQDIAEGNFHHWREAAPSLESAAMYTSVSHRTLSGTSRSRISAMSVSPVFFEMLRVSPVLGSGFKREQEYGRSSDDVLISYDAWQRLFDRRPDAIGSPIVVKGAGDDDVFRVIGVLPENFRFTPYVDVWRPMIIPLPIRAMTRAWREDAAIARLKPGATIDQARAELEVVAARLSREFPKTNAGWTVRVESLHESVIGHFGRATWLLLAAVAVVLLVACLNVGGLFVARAVARERESAVRGALGAGTWRLVRLWLAEASLVGAFGAGLGLFIAWWGVGLLKAAAPPGIPRLDSIAIDGPTLAVAALSTLVAVVIFGSVPMRRVSDASLATGLRAGSTGAGDTRARVVTRAAITLAQCAGAVTLAILAVMLTRSFLKLTAVDLGWDPVNVLSLQASPSIPSENRRPWYARVEWADRLVAELEATPGIERAAVTSRVPLGTLPSYSTLARGKGAAAGEDARWPSVSHKITDGYFDLMGIRLLEGRRFGPEDRFTEPQMIDSAVRPESGTAIVSEQTARTLWPGQPAIGQALWLPEYDVVRWREVVGVVADIQFHAVGETPALHVFVPWTQDSAIAVPLVFVKTTNSASAMAAQVRAAVQSVEPATVVDVVTPMELLVAQATAQSRFTSRAVVAFGLLALALAAVGIYGTLSYLVGARTREIGIRLALGAPRGRILSNVITRGLLPAAGGGVAGVVLALALARTFRALLFNIEPIDLASFAGGAAALLAVAVAAALGPARRAAHVDPVRALRTD
jgi:putative ABC transport system permease protein